jgi:hypothetical protein
LGNRCGIESRQKAIAIQVNDRLAADAVVVEPVSAAKFPVNREKNRDFCKFVASCAPEPLNYRVETRRLTQISDTMKQGIISAEQGILTLEQGISPARTEIVAG